jgi:hypothetical protein
VESESEEEVYRPVKRLVKGGALEETKQIKRARVNKADSESEEKPAKRQKVEDKVDNFGMSEEARKRLREAEAALFA